MSEYRPLRGSCSCGRYNYVVAIPENARDQAVVHFRTDDEHRRSQAALLTAFLRVPLSWYTSHTISFFPDETHHSISKTFSPVEEPSCQRKFCGFCGTHLSYWTEEPGEEKDYMHVTLGSLRNRDLDTLQDLELLPDDVDHEVTQDPDVAMGDTNEAQALAENQAGGVVRTVRESTDGPMTWFEEMLRGSHLGRTRTTKRGVGTSTDGTTTVSYEITEYGDDEDETLGTTGAGSKRKLDETTAEQAL